MLWQLEFRKRQVSKVFAFLVEKVLIQQKLVRISNDLIKETWINLLHNLTAGCQLFGVEIYSLILLSQPLVLNLPLEVDLVAGCLYFLNRLLIFEIMKLCNLWADELVDSSDGPSHKSFVLVSVGMDCELVDVLLNGSVVFDYHLVEHHQLLLLPVLSILQSFGVIFEAQGCVKFINMLILKNLLHSVSYVFRLVINVS